MILTSADFSASLERIEAGWALCKPHDVGRLQTLVPGDPFFPDLEPSEQQLSEKLVSLLGLASSNRAVSCGPFCLWRSRASPKRRQSDNLLDQAAVLVPS